MTDQLTPAEQSAIHASGTAQTEGQHNPVNHGRRDWNCRRCSAPNVWDMEICRGCGQPRYGSEPEWFQRRITRLGEQRNEAWRDQQTMIITAQRLERIIIGLVRHIEETGGDGPGALERIKAELDDDTPPPMPEPLQPTNAQLRMMEESRDRQRRHDLELETPADCHAATIAKIQNGSEAENV